MPGYHELDGVPCHASQALLRDTLRGEWGFDGIVVSDYFAILQLHDYHQVAADPTAAAQLALAAGVDVELPNTACYGDVLVDAVKSGQIAEALLDEVVGRVLAMMIRLGLFEDPFVDAAAALDVSDTPAQRETALRIARKSIVLLKNKQQTLPLRKDLRSIAVIGPNADTIRNLLGDYTYPSHIETLIAVKKEKNTFNQPLPPDISEQDLFLPMTSILARIREKVSAATAVLAAPGCDISDSSADGLAKAAAAASKADVAVVVVGDKSGLTRSCTVGESRDMASLRLPGIQEQLVHAVCATGTPTVVVLVSGRPYAIPGIASEAAAIVEAWLPGEEGAQAVADALFGDYNPGGKLTLSFPRDAGQIPVYYGHKKSGGRSHWFGDYVDMSAQPLYPFGHGLSYTTFEYTNLRISEPEAGLDGAAVISADIRNTGDVAGEEVVQLYIRDSHASVTRPVKELKGFVRIALAAGETKRVTFTLSPRQLGYYNQDMAYGIEPGSIEVMIGSSSEDIRLQGSFNITGPVWMDVPEKAYFSNVTVTPALSPKTA
jgi:beta-glucosidase